MIFSHLKRSEDVCLKPIIVFQSRIFPREFLTAHDVETFTAVSRYKLMEYENPIFIRKLGIAVDGMRLS